MQDFFKSDDAQEFANEFDEAVCEMWNESEVHENLR